MHTEDILLAVAWRRELQKMPEGTESRSQHGRPSPNGSPCSDSEVKKYGDQACDVVETSQALECSFAKLLIGF